MARCVNNNQHDKMRRIASLEEVNLRHYIDGNIKKITKVLSDKGGLIAD